MVCVLSDHECDSIEGRYTAINLNSTFFHEFEGDLPYSVVPDSWYVKGKFPGDHLNYESGAFYSNDYKAKRPAQFIIYFTVRDAMGAEADTYMQFQVVKNSSMAIKNDILAPPPSKGGSSSQGRGGERSNAERDGQYTV